MTTSAVKTTTHKSMADFRPFQAWRYDPKAVSMNHVIAPPYDVISPSEQENLYARSPYNCIRLILNKIEESDTDSQNRYTRARDFYNQWRQEKKVIQENTPSYYLYRQTFQDPRNGKIAERTALLGRLHLEPFEKNIVIPHEKTLSKPRADRRKLTEATATNFSPVFGLYEDPQKEIGLVFSEITKTEPLFEATDDQKVKHIVWAVSDPHWIEQIQQGISSKKIYIADGHHRYQTALEYGADKRKEKGNPAEELNSDFVLMALVEFNDPGLVLLPTHRMILPYEGFDAAQAIKVLEPYFQFEAMPVERVRTEVAKFAGSPKVVFGLLLENQSWLITLKNPDEARRAMMSGKPDVWYQLDVNVLAHLIFKLWKIDESMFESVLRFTHDDPEAIQSIQKREAKATFLLKAPPVSVLRDMGAVQQLMPQKSTYFYPKLASGLVFYSH